MLLLFVYLFIQYTQWWEDNIFLIAEPGRQRQSESWDSLTRQAGLLSNSQTRETPFPEEWHVRLDSSSVCTPVYTCTPMHKHLHKRVHTERERGVWYLILVLLCISWWLVMWRAFSYSYWLFLCLLRTVSWGCLPVFTGLLSLQILSYLYILSGY